MASRIIESREYPKVALEMALAARYALDAIHSAVLDLLCESTEVEITPYIPDKVLGFIFKNSPNDKND
jgi:hypothetical protein